MGSSADLLFRILGDSSQGEAALAQFRAALLSTVESSKAASSSILYDWAGNPIKSLGPEFAAMGAAAETASARTVSSTAAARMAIRGLGTEIGVGMPRFVGSWLASLGPVSGIMGAAFAPIAVIGLVEVLSKLPGELQKGIDWLHGWDEAAKKTFESGEKAAIDQSDALLSLVQRLREIELIGKEGAGRLNLEKILGLENLEEKRQELENLTAQFGKAFAISTYQAPQAQVIGTSSVGAPIYGAKPKAQYSHEDIEKSKTDIELLNTEIPKVRKEIEDLELNQKRVTAEARADGAKAAGELARRGAELNDRLWESNARANKDWIDGLAKQSEEKQRADAETERQANELADRLWQIQQREDKEFVEGLAKQAEEKQRADEEALRQQEAFGTDMARVDEERQRVSRKDDTPAGRVTGQYEADAAKFKAAEEEKTQDVKLSEAQRAAIRTQYAALLDALYTREQTDLQALHNSAGWQGVFGREFAEMVKGNADLTQEWARSTNQSAMMVRMTLEGLKETAHEAFESLSKGMAANITSAFIHEKSIKAAMRSAMESTLESLAAQAVTYAIYSTALGFTDLAEGNEPGAAAAFTAAAIWGSVGAAAAIAGRAMAGGQGGASAPGGGGGSDRSSGGAWASSGSGGPMGTAAGMGQSHITVNVQGHLVGWANIGELTGALNDAVLGGGHVLTATNTTTGVQVIK